jgi:putative MATE family efflux protein
MNVKKEAGRTGLFARRGNLLTDPIGRSLLRLSWPMLIGMFAMTAFNLADTWFVAQLGTGPLAAMTFTFPVVMVLNGLTLGIGTGTTAIISQRYGSGDHDEVRRLARDGLLLAFTLVALITAVGLVTIRPLFSTLGAEGELLEMVSRYMTVWYIGAGFVVVPMVGNSAIRGTGDTQTPAWIMTTAALTNIALDPIFIFGFGPIPALDLMGAALATVIARAVTMIASLYILIHRDRLVLFMLPRLGGLWSRWKQVLVVGGPAALTAVMGPLTFAVFTRLAASHGTDTVAALGAGIRVDMFALMVPFAVGSGLMVFVGQNWGAAKYERVRRSVLLTLRFVIATGLMIYAGIALGASPITSLFTDDAGVVRLMHVFLTATMVGLAADAVFVLAVSIYNALRRPRRVVLLYVVRLVVIMIPLAILGSTLYGPVGLFYGIGAGRLLTGVGTWLVLRPMLKEVKGRAHQHRSSDDAFKTNLRGEGEDER